MGVEYFTCDICNGVTNDCVSDSIFINTSEDSNNSYILCEDCSYNCKSKMGLGKSLGEDTRDFNATKEYFEWKVSDIKSKLSVLNSDLEKANLQLEEFLKNSKNKRKSEEIEDETENQQDKKQKSETVKTIECLTKKKTILFVLTVHPK